MREPKKKDASPEFFRIPAQIRAAGHVAASPRHCRNCPQLVKQFQKVSGPRDFGRTVSGSVCGWSRNYSESISSWDILFFCVLNNIFYFY